MYTSFVRRARLFFWRGGFQEVGHGVDRRKGGLGMYYGYTCVRKAEGVGLGGVGSEAKRRAGYRGGSGGERSSQSVLFFLSFFLFFLGGVSVFLSSFCRKRKGPARTRRPVCRGLLSSAGGGGEGRAGEGRAFLGDRGTGELAACLSCERGRKEIRGAALSPAARAGVNLGDVLCCCCCWFGGVLVFFFFGSSFRRDRPCPRPPAIRSRSVG